MNCYDKVRALSSARPPLPDGGKAPGPRAESNWVRNFGFSPAEDSRRSAGHGSAVTLPAGPKNVDGISIRSGIPGTDSADVQYTCLCTFIHTCIDAHRSGVYEWDSRICICSIHVRLEEKRLGNDSGAGFAGRLRRLQAEDSTWWWVK